MRQIEVRGIRADVVLAGDEVDGAVPGEVSMGDPRSAYFERPMGFYSEELRQRFIDASARIAGVGGGGLTLAVMLAKEGVRDFSIADVDMVDATNVGRIPLLTPNDIGRPKVEVAAELITTHNPGAVVRVYGNGVQRENADEFVGYDAGNRGMTVCFDEIEITEPAVALNFHRAARRHRRYVVCATDVERGGLATTFAPDRRRYTFEHCNGAGASDTEEEFVRKVRGFQLPTIPNIPPSGTKATLAAAMGGAPLPTTLRSVLNATDLAMDEFEKLLTLDLPHYRRPHIYPRIHAVNPSRGEDFVTRFPRVRATARIAQLYVRDSLGLNPAASYSDAQRHAREYRRRSFVVAAALPDKHADLFASAGRAPSAHNTQPWQIQPAGNGRDYELRYLQTPELPSDPGDRDAYLTMGAFVETMVLSGAHHGLHVAVTPDFTRTGRTLRAARVSITDRDEGAPVDPLSAFVDLRHVNRQPYAKDTVPPGVATVLEGLGNSLVSTAELKDAVRTSTMALWRDPEYVRCLGIWLRSNDTAPDGITPGAFELSKADQLALRFAVRRGSLKSDLLTSAFAARDVAAFVSGSTAAVLSVPEKTPAELFGAGRRLLRSWLTVAGAGLSYQPFSCAVDDPGTASRVAAVAGVANPVALYRIGIPIRPATGRSGRREISQLVTATVAAG